MATWDQWTPDVAADVPACPSITLERAVKLTVIDFLERSHWIQRTAEPIDIAGGAASRSFPSSIIATGETVLAVMRAWISGEEVPVYGPADVENDRQDWKTLTGAPDCIVQERMDGYYVVPSPTSTMTAALRLKCAIGLLETATSCDDSIRVHWRDAIADGAKARLMFMPDKPWTSANLASSYQTRYLDSTKAASVRAIRTPARRPLQTKPYWF